MQSFTPVRPEDLKNSNVVSDALDLGRPQEFLV